MWKLGLCVFTSALAFSSAWSHETTPMTAKKPGPIGGSPRIYLMPDAPYAGAGGEGDSGVYRRGGGEGGGGSSVSRGVGGSGVSRRRGGEGVGDSGVYRHRAGGGGDFDE